ncbi:GGDEF domain-containing protein [Alteromonas sp. ASW11-130]|uniref:GGDEF domain-containing protein n=1 Tax=Alteromonas sp. ASW11-130 TaxID=3015775 RepID=UPI0022419E6A|nr:GGDEF domain-containing protein [Alteromonas sp. ASW11-130]MCW8092276.1 GGDEF domain-containing protein [Alteromonas sp. ASW11-130]
MLKWFQRLSIAEDEFLYKSSLRIASVFIVTGLPFAISLLLNGQSVLAIFSIGIIAVLALNALSTYRYKRYHTDIILFGLVPIVTVFLLESLLTQGLYGSLWCFPAVIACFFMLPERRAWIASTIMLAILIPNIWLTFDTSLSFRLSIALVMVASFTAIFIRMIVNQQQKLQKLAVTDELTGLRNKRTLENELTTTIEQSKRTLIPVSILILEIDHLKQIYEKYGQDIADGVLQGVSNYLKQRCRKVDLLYRLSDDKFLVVLFNAPKEKANLVAEQLRISIEKLYLLQGTNVTASFGIAGLSEHDNCHSLMRRAEQYLLKAKQHGRNQTFANDEEFD